MNEAATTQFQLWGWLAFGVLLLGLLAVDLAVHRGARADSRSAAVVWSGIWVGVGLLFAVFVWWRLGGASAQEYLGAYLVEKSLSLDNLFVFLVVFRSLRIPREHQRTVLSWGIFGALVFRAVFVVLGVAAIERYDWIVYVFAVILFWAAFRIVREDPATQRENRAVRWLSRRLPVTDVVHGDRFLAKVDGRWVATPLLIALIAVELTDITFAVDSVPAALAISQDRFVVYTSNAFAILGLRSLYLVLEDVLGKLRHLHYGLAAVLAFAGLKMIASDWIHVPPLVSVAIIVACIGVSVATSIRSARRAASAGPGHRAGGTTVGPRAS